MKESRILEVHYKNQIVGRLAETQDRRIAFQYDEAWLKNGFSISPFSLPLKPEVFVPHERSLDRFYGLFGVFADSLPDAWGNLLLDRYLENAGIKRDTLTALDRLAYIGRSGMGALEYFPSEEKDFGISAASISYDRIAGECAKLLTSHTSDVLDILYRIGASSGGTRPKIMVSKKGEDWIIKFPSGKDPAVSGKREYDYSVCAKKCGINMTDTNLIKSEICDGYFKTVRFDRKLGNKIFSVTAAGLLEADFRAPSCSYESLFKLVSVLTRSNKLDKEQMYRIMCFNVLTHNRDDHAKNFSFLYSDDQSWHLSPAYDLTYSDTYWGEHTSSVNGKGRDISKDDLIKAGTGAGLSKKKCDQWYEEVCENIKPLKNYIDNSGYGRGRHISFMERLEEL